MHHDLESEFVWELPLELKILKFGVRRHYLLNTKVLVYSEIFLSSLNMQLLCL
jgi:hypothetical protein